MCFITIYILKLTLLQHALTNRTVIMVFLSILFCFTHKPSCNSFNLIIWNHSHLALLNLKEIHHDLKSESDFRKKCEPKISKAMCCLHLRWSRRVQGNSALPMIPNKKIKGKRRNSHCALCRNSYRPRGYKTVFMLNWA